MWVGLWVRLGGAAVPLRTSQPCTCVPCRHVQCLLCLLANRCGTPAACWLGLWGCRGDSALPSWQPHPKEELCGEEPGALQQVQCNWLRAVGAEALLGLVVAGG